MTICDICGKPIPYQRMGRPRVRHAGACEREERRRYQARWIAIAAPKRTVVRIEPVVGDDPTPVIEAKLAEQDAYLRARRRAGAPLFQVDGWQRRGEA
jgi:hypothetical protein